MSRLLTTDAALAIGKQIQRVLPAGSSIARHIDLAVRKGEMVRGRLNLERIGACAFEIAVHGKSGGRPFVIVTIHSNTVNAPKTSQTPQPQQASSIGDLILTVSQELAFPLNRVYKHVDQMMQLLGESLDRRIDAQLTGIVRQIYRISSLAHNLVALAKHSVPNFVQVNLNDVLLDAIDQCEQERGRAVALSLYLQDALPAILADPFLLASIFQNLIFVSDELAGDDGVPRIRTSYCDDLRQVRIAFKTRGPVVSITELERSFELFQDDARLSPGCLLGLFISKKLLQVQQAGLELSMSAEHGNIFEVVFNVANHQTGSI